MYIYGFCMNICDSRQIWVNILIYIQIMFDLFMALFSRFIVKAFEFILNLNIFRSFFSPFN